MAKRDAQAGYWDMKRRTSTDFDRLVSPLGEDVEETPVYSPSRTVNGARGQPTGRASRAESAKDQRRG